MSIYKKENSELIKLTGFSGGETIHSIMKNI